MAYVTLNDLAGKKRRRRARRAAQAGSPQESEEGMGQDSRQQSWWDWFFTGVGPKPKKPYKEVAFKKQQAGATFTPNKKWGGMEFEAEAAEDLDPFKAQGYDAAQALGGLGQIDQWGAGLADGTTPTAPAPAPVAPVAPAAPVAKSSKVLVGALVLGGLAALAYSAMPAAPKPETKEEAGLRELEEALGVKLRNGRKRRRN